MPQAALALAEKKNAELSDSLEDEKADRILYLLKSQVRMLTCLLCFWQNDDQKAKTTLCVPV